MDDSGIDSDTTKRHTPAIEQNDRVIILLYVNVFLSNFRNPYMLLKKCSIYLTVTTIIDHHDLIVR